MRRTDKTLLEQMQISDVEIGRRMDLLGLDKPALDLLASHNVLIEEHIDEIVDEFYKRQTEIDEISLLIGDADTLARLRAAQRRYVLDLFAGHYDSEYVNNRLRIGLVHKRIGVEPKLYLSAVRTLKEILIRTLSKCITESSVFCETSEALDKLIYFDTTLVFDTYIDSLVEEIRSAKNRTEIYAKSLEDKVAERTQQLEQQAKLDALTNLYNHRAMKDLMRREMARCKRHHIPLSMIYFDIDNFKYINDTFGHSKGDEVLKFIGKLLPDILRREDVPSRCGGDEFCILLCNCKLENAEKICQKIIKDFTGKYPDFSLSMGIATTTPNDLIDDNELLKMADEKMYEAKKEQGSHICV